MHLSKTKGLCGSCWSISAIGSLEASIARNTAMDIFYSQLPPDLMSLSQKWSRNDTTIATNEIHSRVPQNQLNIAVQNAQIIEKKAFNVSKLSIQELIDCDTRENQGCIGGNPVMAFPFIHKYGLVSNSQYPYEGKQNRHCEVDKLKPIATTDSWGILRAKDESKMEFVLRHIGPISVGFNGSDKSFLNYKGGIYDSKLCRDHPNHAMLITGYGEERNQEGELVSCTASLIFKCTFSDFLTKNARFIIAQILDRP